jgi:hypothetical protein
MTMLVHYQTKKDLKAAVGQPSEVHRNIYLW